ncbi:hypothetical protein [Pedobacter agri]|uniref:hypothetical protein n=1 Tax=Pedobacter agri TaxID=454586 RepID=UPI00293117D2|nr:hypothetical protein [Pedobacter agri]
MKNLSEEAVREFIEYYKQQLVSAEFKNNSISSGTLNITIKNDADIVKASKGAEYAYNDQGDSLQSFGIIVSTEDGKQTESFKHIGENEEFGDL